MRNLIFSINVTLDGCCDHTKGIADGELHEYFARFLRKVDVLVYGRKTYQLMVPYWPDVAKNRSGSTEALNDFAQAFDSVGKIVVFSRSLKSVEGKNTTIVRGNLREAMLALKQEPGGDIALGGVDLPSQLMELGLIDEYRIVVHPVIAGEGRRLFDGVSLQERLHLRLVDSSVFKSGCVALRYSRR